MKTKPIGAALLAATLSLPALAWQPPPYDWQAAQRQERWEMEMSRQRMERQQERSREDRWRRQQQQDDDDDRRRQNNPFLPWWLK